MNNLLHELEAWATVQNKPIWLEKLVSELGVDKTLELAKAIRFNQENAKALEYMNRVLDEELDRRISFLM